MAIKKNWFGTIRSRLLFGNIALATIPLVLLAGILVYIAVLESESALEAEAKNEMLAIRTAKQAEIVSYFHDLANELVVLASTQQVHDAALRMPSLLQSLPSALPVSMERARQAVAAYYNGPFQSEFGRRNPGRRFNADKALASLVAALKPVTIAAQYFYIANNPHPPAEKFKLLAAASDPSDYSALHAQIHTLAGVAVTRSNLYDLALVDLKGNIIYSYAKELDFGTNLKTGPWTKTEMGQAFNTAIGLPAGKVQLSNFAAYIPSYLHQVIFLSTPVYDGERQVGVLIMQVPIDQVNTVMTFGGQWQESGLGETGEVYLVGADKSMLSTSRLLLKDSNNFLTTLKSMGLSAERLATIQAHRSNAGSMPLDTLGVHQALAGIVGVATYKNYLGIPVLGAYAPVQVLNQNWGILAEITKAEADASALALRHDILVAATVTLVVLALVAILFSLVLARSINRPLAHFTEVVGKVAEGDNEARVHLETNDEIGQLGGAFDGMLDERIATQQRIERENDALNNSIVAILGSVAELANRDLGVRVPVAEDVTGAVSDAINMMANSTAGALGKVRGISDAVSNASLNVRTRSDQVQEVARAASEQATAASAELQQTAVALRGMGQQAQDANEHAERAIRTTNEALEIVRATVDGIFTSRDQIREMEKRIKRLGERSQEITSVVNLISDIAERTSVLALNASMQAVAAGEAGSGFAVVADEVKRLAENASQATKQISSLVNAIQADTSETIQAMNDTIAQVVDISKLADRAGGQMNDTRQVTEQLAEAVRAIATSSKAQGEASETLLTRAYELLQSAQRTLEELDMQRHDTEALGSSARDLVSTVSEFKLPA